MFGKQKRIGLVVHKGVNLFIYDEDNRQIGMKGMQRGDELYHFSESGYTIKRGRNLFIYDANGRQISMRGI
jgi:hypothetical protein